MTRLGRYERSTWQYTANVKSRAASSTDGFVAGHVCKRAYISQSVHSSTAFQTQRKTKTQRLAQAIIFETEFGEVGAKLASSSPLSCLGGCRGRSWGRSCEVLGISWEGVEGLWRRFGVCRASACRHMCQRSTFTAFPAPALASACACHCRLYLKGARKDAQMPPLAAQLPGCSTKTISFLYKNNIFGAG